MSLFFWLSVGATPVLALLMLSVARADARMLRRVFSPVVAERWRLVAPRTRLLLAVGPTLLMAAVWLAYALAARRGTLRDDASALAPLLVWLSLLWLVQVVPRWRRHG